MGLFCFLGIENLIRLLNIWPCGVIGSVLLYHFNTKALFNDASTFLFVFDMRFQLNLRNLIRRGSNANIYAKIIALELLDVNRYRTHK